VLVASGAGVHQIAIWCWCCSQRAPLVGTRPRQWGRLPSFQSGCKGCGAVGLQAQFVFCCPDPAVLRSCAWQCAAGGGAAHCGDAAQVLGGPAHGGSVAHGGVAAEVVGLLEHDDSGPHGRPLDVALVLAGRFLPKPIDRLLVRPTARPTDWPVARRPTVVTVRLPLFTIPSFCGGVGFPGVVVLVDPVECHNPGRWTGRQCHRVSPKPIDRLLV